MLPLAFGFGSPTEIAMIAGVVLVLFGGSKLAGFGKSLGDGIKEFKKATSDDEHTAVVTPASPTVTVPPVVSHSVTTEEK